MPTCKLPFVRDRNEKKKKKRMLKDYNVMRKLSLNLRVEMVVLVKNITLLNDGYGCALFLMSRFKGLRSEMRWKKGTCLIFSKVIHFFKGNPVKN